MAMLEVRDLEVYYGVIQAIKGISFDVNQGEIVALIGANGAGKTTTLRHHHPAVISAKTGKIVYEGTDITRVPGYKLVGMGIAHVPEDRNLNGCAPEMSVRDNLIATSLKRLSGKGSILKPKEIESYCGKCVEDFTVKNDESGYQH